MRLWLQGTKKLYLESGAAGVVVVGAGAVLVSAAGGVVVAGAVVVSGVAGAVAGAALVSGAGGAAFVVVVVSVVAGAELLWLQPVRASRENAMATSDAEEDNFIVYFCFGWLFLPNESPSIKRWGDLYQRWHPQTSKANTRFFHSDFSTWIRDELDHRLFHLVFSVILSPVNLQESFEVVSQYALV